MKTGTQKTVTAALELHNLVSANGYAPARNRLVKPAPRFSELNKVRGINAFRDVEGYVIASLFRDDRWVYKVSISEDPGTEKTWDNWIPEEFLELSG